MIICASALSRPLDGINYAQAVCTAGNRKICCLTLADYSTTYVRLYETVLLQMSHGAACTRLAVDRREHRFACWPFLSP